MAGKGRPKEGKQEQEAIKSHHICSQEAEDRLWSEL